MTAQSQIMTPQDQDQDNMTRRQLANFDNFLDSHPEVAEQLRKDPSLVNNQQFVQSHPELQEYLQQHPEVHEQISENPNGTMHQEQRFDRREGEDRDRDRHRGELATFDRFLDRHPEIDEQLRKDPSLVNNKQFVENHPDLQQFLAEHPVIRDDAQDNPKWFMHQEQRFDRREGEDRERDRDRDRNRGELATFDRFLDSHPEIAEQLRKDPSLVNNKQFVENHPALQQFLAEHPVIRDDAQDNPKWFAHQEQRYDRHEEERGDRGDRDVNRRELANMDRFMDTHPEIAEQLRKDPSLVNNKRFVENHPALQQFLADHPGVREEYKENPTAFMHQEQRYDRYEDMRREREGGRGELSSFNEFLGGHSSIAGELSKNPSLANNQEFLATHPELQDYLKQNPKVQAQLSANPQTFLQSAQQFNTHSTPTTKGGVESKPK